MSFPFARNSFRLLGLLLAASLGLTATGRAGAPDDTAYRTAFLARCDEISEGMARRTWSPGEDTRMRLYLGVAKVATGIDAAEGLRYLEEAVADTTSHWHSFEPYVMMDAVIRLGDKLPPPLVARIRTRLAGCFTSDFGFTDNHMLQIHTARYLFAGVWPDGPVFADGSTPAQARRDSAAWIRRWINTTVKQGMFEYDSPNYHHLYLLCFASLHEFSDDELLRRQSWMIMQVLLAEWATEYHSGTWVGAHSREKHDQVLHTHEHTGAATQFGRLYFGGAPIRLDLAENFFLPLAALQRFEALPLIGRMALDRTAPYVLRELKPPRRGPRIHYGEPTWKYTHVAPDFAVGSSWGDLTDVEQHRWDLTWLSPHDGSTCFFINPSYDVQQLHRYFEDPVDKLLGAILRARPYYANPNKWVEPSPYEDVFQQDTAVIDLYDIPPHSARQHINGFFPHHLEEKREQDGWIFCRAEGVYFGVWTSAPGVWHREKDHDRLTLTHPKTAVILEAAAAKDEKSFDDFCARLRAGRPQFDEATLTATYTNLQGRQLRFTHRGPRVVDGATVNLEAWPLFEGPWMNARPGTGIITLRYGSERVTLDFNTISVSNEIIQ